MNGSKGDKNQKETDVLELLYEEELESTGLTVVY